MTSKSIAASALLFSGAVAATAIAGSRFNPSREGTREWYAKLEKPPYMPPGAAFGIVWPVLYVLIATSGARVWRSGDTTARSHALNFWTLQMLFNAAWSPLFFGAKQPAIALADIAFLLGSVTAYTESARRSDRTAAWLMTPYLAWLLFALLLNVEIVRLNGRV